MAAKKWQLTQPKQMIFANFVLMAKKGAKRTKRRNNENRVDRFIRWVTVCGVVGLVSIGCAIYYLLRHHPNIVVDRNQFPIVGIDISKHNGDIDFAQLAADSLSFVFIKATEGNEYVDPTFEHNYTKAKEAGLKVGAYHYFRMAKNGTVQAYNFLKAVKGKEIDLPLVIDVEEWGNDMFVDRGDAVSRLEKMIECIEANNYKVMIYTNKDGYKKYIQNCLSDKMLWICTFKQPHKVENYNWTILQYSHWGEVAGINGEVDLDVFNGDQRAWQRWLQSL
ncbi:MAG: glycoside hydrolase family 25 protein [Muribaculaceae bacterium]